MYLADTIWNAMGWCPMQAATRYPVQGAVDETPRKAIPDDGGPVARRSARFMRLTWGVVILSWIVAFLTIPHLPDVIPIHWGLHGEPNGFTDRLTGALGVPAIITLIMILMLILPRFDSVQFSLAPFRDIYALIILATISMTFCIELMTLAIALGIGLPVVSIISILIGILFIVMGALMPHIGRNTMMGIRLPWTLTSEEVWKKTHDYAGPLFTGAGISVVIGGLIAGTWALAVMLVIILGVTVYICIWSYRLAKRCPTEV